MIKIATIFYDDVVDKASVEYEECIMNGSPDFIFNSLTKTGIIINGDSLVSAKKMFKERNKTEYLEKYLDSPTSYSWDKGTEK